MPKLRNEVGDRYSRLVLVKRETASGSNLTHWLCKCDCGSYVVVKQVDLRRAHIKSCGCLRRELAINRNTTHGLCRHKLHNMWLHILQRCNNKNNKGYKYYGGRGITVCKEWEESLQSFIDWAEPIWKPGLQIDRIDNDGNYEPSNCRFVTALENSHNKRLLSSSNTSGYVGVSLKHGKWSASIRSKLINNDKLVWLGLFNTAEEAVKARNAFILEKGLPHKIQEI